MSLVKNQVMEKIEDEQEEKNAQADVEDIQGV